LESDIRAFLNYLRVEKGLSTNTLHAYRRDLAKFAAFSAKRRLTLRDYQHTEVVDFLRTLYLKKLDSRTVARHLVTVRHLFRFAFTEGIIKEDPAARSRNFLASRMWTACSRSQTPTARSACAIKP
jgi:integrase/recombinase XerD